jgi:hypothetical protein
MTSRTQPAPARPTLGLTPPRQIDPQAVATAAAATGFVSREPMANPASDDRELSTPSSAINLRPRRRPRPERPVQMNVRITQAHAQRLYDLADARGVPLADLLENAIDLLVEVGPTQNRNR